jgi:hypothetical protein
MEKRCGRDREEMQNMHGTPLEGDFVFHFLLPVAMVGGSLEGGEAERVLQDKSRLCMTGMVAWISLVQSAERAGNCEQR